MTKSLIILTTLLLLGGCGDSSPKVTFNIAGAVGLILQEEVTSNSSSFAQALTTSEIVTNLQALADDGTLSDALTVEESSSSLVKINHIAVAPTGEVYVFFQHSVIVNTEECNWVIVNIDNTASCIDPRIIQFYRGSDVPENLAMISFTATGDLIYGTEGNGIYEDLIAIGNSATYIKKRNRETGAINTLLDAELINMTFREFLLAPDGSLFLSAALEGTSQSFFQFIPSLEGKGQLREPCLSEFEDIHVTADERVFVIGPSNTCGSDGESNRATLFQVTWDDDGVTITPASSGETDSPNIATTGPVKIIEDSEGKLYITKFEKETLVLATPGAFETIALTSITEVLLSSVEGDYVYLAGKNAEDQYVLIRKHLLGDREEVDLIGGRDLVIQKLDVAENGDVYIGALDLDTTTVKLLKYVNATGALEEIDSLPSDVQQIILL